MCLLFHSWMYIESKPYVYQLIDWKVKGYEIIEKCKKCSKERIKESFYCERK